jgi:SAM-dependent methyltransferase
MNTDPHHWSPEWQRDLMAQAPAVANVLRPQGDFAIIGPGGGVDVLRAVGSGSKNVTAIEINPLIANTVMRERYADYAYHLYDIPEVHLHVADGRSWIRNSKEKYDVIQMTLVDTWASTAAGAFALSENNLYTVEAFQEYFDHLKPDGILAITRWEFKQPREALRVVSQAQEAMGKTGVEDMRAHFIVISDGPLDEDGRPVTVLAKKGPFTPAEVERVTDYLGSNSKLHALYVPSSEEPGLGDLARKNAFQELIALDGGLLGCKSPRGLFICHYAYDITPVTDNAPFFFFTIKTSSVLKSIFAGSGHGMDWRINLGVVVLWMLLLISLVAVLAFLVLPLAFRRGAPGPGTRPLLYFVAVGLGYILVEIAFIQRFVLFLGHPTYALTVVVFLLLLSSGAGSLTSRRWLSDPRQVRWVLAAITAGLAALVFLLPRVLGAWIGIPFPAKLAVSALLLVPVGFAMGMPFPTGLRQLTERGQGGVEWAWAMNAGASVLGSAVAMAIAIHLGIAATLASGAAAYLVAAALARDWRPVPAPQP